MKLFNIYIRKSENEIIEDFLAIKCNFAWLAFIFNALWFLQHRMFKEVALLTLIHILLISFFSKNIFGLADIFILELGLSLIVGLNAHHWHEEYLKKGNYQFAGCVFGHNKDEAKLHFVSNCFKNKSVDQAFSPLIADLKYSYKKESQQYFTV
jgi:hypothetical protein